MALDWGIRTSVQFLTQGRVNPVERFGFQSLDHPGGSFAADLAPYLDGRDTRYVFYAPEHTVFRGRREALEQLAHQRGLSLTTGRTIYDRGGQPLYSVMEARAE